MKETLGKIQQALNTRLRKLQNGSDYDKWTPIESFPESWDPRTLCMAKLLDPGMSVVEFGAGRRVLENVLPENCSYTPSDFVDRGPGTIICDLNKTPLPSFGEFDTAFFAGVLEYVNDVPRLANKLVKDVDYIVTSYCAADLNTAKKSLERRAKGWVNDYTSQEFVSIFENAGFALEVESKWRTQPLYRFKTRKV